KTTKTIEFCDGAAPSETVIKNTLVAAHEAKPEKSEVQHQSHTRSLLRPSMIKRQQASEDKIEPKSTPKKLMSTDRRASTSTLRADHETFKDTDSSHRDGGLAPPQTNNETVREEKCDQSLYETLLEEAKSMALTSMIEAAKTPSSCKKKTANKPSNSGPAAQVITGTTSSPAKPRPFSAPLKIASSKTLDKTLAPKSAASDKHKCNYLYTTL
ncbi:hypothetical protein EGW08_009554, partial [Elysia chlorotica]